MQKTKKGQIYSLEAIIGALVTASIMLLVGIYVVTIVGNQFAAGSTGALNATYTNVTGLFGTIAPLLVVVGIIAMIAIVLMFVRGGIGGGNRGGM